MSERPRFQPTHVLHLHKAGTRVTLPVQAGGSFESVTPLFTYTEWTTGEPAAWSFDPKQTSPLLLNGGAAQGYDRCELIAIENMQGGLQ